MTVIVVESRFRGPPASGNGGYVSGRLAAAVGGPCTVVLRAPIPLETPLRVVQDGEAFRLLAPDETLIAEARPASETFADRAPPPTFSEAERAARRFPGLGGGFHPICFTCADRLDPSEGLRVFAGAVAGRADDLVAAPWTPHGAFVDGEGLARPEVIWAALDCPGSVAWIARGGHAGLLGTMSARLLRRPAYGETTLVVGWPIEASGRKRLSGTALYTVDGTLLAESRQTWISFAPMSPVQAP